MEGRSATATWTFLGLLGNSNLQRGQCLELTPGCSVRRLSLEDVRDFFVGPEDVPEMVHDASRHEFYSACTWLVTERALEEPPPPTKGIGEGDAAGQALSRLQAWCRRQEQLWPSPYGVFGEVVDVLNLLKPCWLPLEVHEIHWRRGKFTRTRLEVQSSYLSEVYKGCSQDGQVEFPYFAEYQVSQAELSGFRSLQEQVRALPALEEMPREKEIFRHFLVGWGAFRRADRELCRSPRGEPFAFLLYMIALDALILRRGEAQRNCLKRRMRALLGPNAPAGLNAFLDRCYDLRCNMVHGDFALGDIPFWRLTPYNWSPAGASASSVFFEYSLFPTLSDVREAARQALRHTLSKNYEGRGRDEIVAGLDGARAGTDDAAHGWSRARVPSGAQLRAICPERWRAIRFRRRFGGLCGRWREQSGGLGRS